MFFKRRGGQKARWRLVVALELIKAICRTIMFWVTGRRMVIEGSTTGERPLIPEHPQERNPQDEPPQETETLSSGGAVSAAAKDHETAVQEERTKEWNMPRTGMKLPVLPTQGGESITDFLSKRVISADDIKVASQLVRKISSYQGQLAEMMWIARPVVYALAMQRLQGTAGRVPLFAVDMSPVGLAKCGDEKEDVYYTYYGATSNTFNDVLRNNRAI
ncbi:MAG: hypothetical protein LQ339_004332 [Xanthoria mediterranea]|nr:MAG: hypothetical protein LQ339_004332 [Xanthoria mediterranea]